MNNDGWGFLGAGTSDNRLAGTDLQHNRQTRTADELHVPVRIVTQSRESGGPMKEHTEHQMHHEHPEHQLKEEKHRHDKAMEHHKHHLERHHGRHYDSQHGHDNYKY